MIDPSEGTAGIHSEIIQIFFYIIFQLKYWHDYTKKKHVKINTKGSFMNHLFFLLFFPLFFFMTKYRDQQVKPSKYAIIRWFGFDQFVPERAVTSYWVSSKTFFVIRFIIALYSTVVFWTYLGLLASFADVRGFFSAFTTLTFIGLHAYLVVSLLQAFQFMLLISRPIDCLCISFSLFTA